MLHSLLRLPSASQARCREVREAFSPRGQALTPHLIDHIPYLPLLLAHYVPLSLFSSWYSVLLRLAMGFL